MALDKAHHLVRLKRSLPCYCTCSLVFDMFIMYCFTELTFFFTSEESGAGSDGRQCYRFDPAQEDKSEKEALTLAKEMA